MPRRTTFQSLILLLLAAAAGGRGASIHEAPHPPGLTLPQFLNDLDQAPEMPTLSAPMRGGWVWTWRNGKWTVEWAPDGAVIFVGDPWTGPEAFADLPMRGLSSAPLSETPEPSAWLMIAGGLLALGFFRRSRY